jgi:nitroreductase
VRIYLKEDLADPVIDEMLSPVGLSPTGHNDQGLRVTVVSGADRVQKKLVRPVLRILAFADSLRLVTLLSGRARPMVRRLRAGEDLLAWGAPCVLFFHAPLKNVTGSADTVIAAAAVEIKARAMGLGTLWNGVLKILSPLLGMGRSGAVLCVGYPGVRNRWKLPGRRWTRRQPS